MSLGVSQFEVVDAEVDGKKRVAVIATLAIFPFLELESQFRYNFLALRFFKFFLKSLNSSDVRMVNVT